CSVDFPASLGPTTRFMEEPKCRSIPCRVPKPSIWIRLSRMIRTSGAVYGSFVEGVQRQLQSAACHLLLLSRLALLIDQLAHHLTPAGEFLSDPRSEEHTSELQSPYDLVCRLLLEKKNKTSQYFRSR